MSNMEFLRLDIVPMLYIERGIKTKAGGSFECEKEKSGSNSAQHGSILHFLWIGARRKNWLL